MYAVVANGIKTICYTQRQLDTVLAIYPYPKFAKCSTEFEARQWLLNHNRSIMTRSIQRYGETNVAGYVNLFYEITEQGIRYELKLDKLGCVRMLPDDNMIVDARQDVIYAICDDVKLDDSVITHHVIAIHRILKSIGSIVDVNINVPDISVYLALVKYRGNNRVIQDYKNHIASRLGALSYTVKEL